MPRCELCEGTDFELIATDIREGEGRIARCRRCELVIQDLGWTPEQLAAYYEREYQQTNSLVAGAELAARAHHEERLKNIGSIVERVLPLVRTGDAVLDIGAGAGTLLSRLRPPADRCVGVEMNTPFVEFMRKELGIEGHARDVNVVDFAGAFDVIVSINTLDHLADPLRTLRTIRRLLKPDGRVYLEVPNQEEAMNAFLPEPQGAAFRRFFWHRAHLFYFTRSTIEALCRKAGLEVEVSCRHEYTLKNFLNWYFTGRPQKDFVGATTESRFFPGDSPFERGFDGAMARAEAEFKRVLAETFRGDSLCCVGRACAPRPWEVRG